MKLLTVENAKTTKGENLGFLTGILYLAPYNLSGRNVCSHASEGCAAACLFTAGMGIFANVQTARKAKTLLFFRDSKEFIELLEKDITALIKRAKKLGLIPCVRLNGTSDLPWESLGGTKRINLFNRFPSVQFYDYTKNPTRFDRQLPANYQLTFSRSECNGDTVTKLMERGENVAVVFSSKKGEDLPATWQGREVVDGDLHDLRFLDGKNKVVGLRAKGKAKKDDSGFSVTV